MNSLPMGDADDRPWELPGGQRLDVLPHRAASHHYLALVSLLGGILACGFFPLSLLSLPLAITTVLRASADLGEMRQDIMDSSGETQTREARQMAVTGAVFSTLGLLGWGWFYRTFWWP